MNISNKVLLSRNNMKHEVVSVSFLYSLWNKRSIFFFCSYHAAYNGKANSSVCSYESGVTIHSGTYFPSAKHSSLTVELLATGTTSGNCTSIFGSYSPITPAVTERKKGEMPHIYEGGFFQLKDWKGHNERKSKHTLDHYVMMLYMGSKNFYISLWEMFLIAFVGL